MYIEIMEIPATQDMFGGSLWTWCLCNSKGRILAESCDFFTSKQSVINSVNEEMYMNGLGKMKIKERS